MTSLITLICLVSMIIPASIANIFMYPVSKKASLGISNYIEHVLAPRLFAIMHKYKKFHFYAYDDYVDQLPENFIIISNHQSLLDIPTYMRFINDRELRFIAKDVLGRHVPLVSEMLRVQKHCLIPRNAKPMEAMRFVEKFGEKVVRENQIPVLFPEGTRTKNGNVGKFFSAGFRKLTDASKLPVVVCALDGGWQLRDLLKIFRNMKYGSYRVKILKIYDSPETKDQCNAILDESRVLIQNQLDEWRRLKPSEK